MRSGLQCRRSLSICGKETNDQNITTPLVKCCSNPWKVALCSNAFSLFSMALLMIRILSFRLEISFSLKISPNINPRSFSVHNFSLSMAFFISGGIASTSILVKLARHFHEKQNSRAPCSSMDIGVASETCSSVITSIQSCTPSSSRSEGSSVREAFGPAALKTAAYCPS